MNGKNIISDLEYAIDMCKPVVLENFVIKLTKVRIATNVSIVDKLITSCLKTASNKFYIVRTIAHKEDAMALPIAATPVLKGKTAVRFLSKIEETAKITKKPVPTPRARMALDKILADAGIR